MVTAVFPEAAAGADDALELLYRDHAQDVSRYALAVLGDRADAEDVTQTTFLNAFRALQRGERPRQPDHWLIAIAHNACRERFRSGQRHPREVAFVEEVGAAAVRDDDGPTADELRAALLQLRPSQRAALVMRELEGRPNSEIASALGLSVSAVETLLFRARQALREQLGEQLLCGEALVAIARQTEGALPRGERAGLRAHLRRCPDCAQVARSRRARRTVLGGFVPVPSWLSSLLGSGGAGGAGLLAKAAAIVVTGAVVGGGVSAGAAHVGRGRAHHRPNTFPVAVTPSHARASLSAAHVPLRVIGPGGRPASIAPPVGSASRPETVPGQATAAAPEAPAQSDSPVGTGTAVPQVTGLGQAAAPPPLDGNAVKPGQGPGASAGPNGNGVPAAPGNSGKVKVPPGQVKKNQQPAAAPPAASPGSPTPDPPVPAQPTAPGNGQGNGQANGQGNGQANGQGNGQANGQGNGQAAAPPAGPPASVPPQSNAGGNGNGHH